MRHEVIVGVERRRRWSDDQKLEILRGVGVDGATVADVARRWDITRQHIYQWRRELRRKGLWPCASETVFLALGAPAEEADAGGAAAESRAMVEVALANGRALRVDSGIGEADLARLIRVVEAA